MNLGILAKEHTVAGPGFNRWLVPPAALAIHLCIGMAYGLSVFWLPLSRTVGAACPADMSLWSELFVTSCDWKVSSLVWTFTIGIVFLGLAAAVFGGWLEHAGPRKAGVVAALCWGGGWLISAYGVTVHQLWMIWLGLGFLGGIGLGLGYISPVSTLIKWFPDRRGMATGMAIMGFGGGAMIGSPLGVMLMNHFASAPGKPGVASTFVAFGIIYFLFMMGGAFGYRVPATGWKPEGWSPEQGKEKKHVTTGHVHLSVAWKTPQFWLIWMVLAMNVSAGIGIISMASPMLQEIFAGKLISLQVGFNDLTPDQKKAIAAIAGGFTGLLSLFNIVGRFFWASLSDWVGRKHTYYAFFLIGIALYSSATTLAHGGHLALFVLAFCIILSMYGGGFSTVPAYLADIFGTQMVGAIHGRLLTAWSTAGIVGPVVVTYIRDTNLAAGVPRDQLYDKTMTYLVIMLVIGLVCNFLVRPVAEKNLMTEAELAAERQLAHERAAAAASEISGAVVSEAKSGTGTLVLAWLAVGIPLLWGFFITVDKAWVLFK
ncbi:MAG: OFA family MFS transporter [Betaproteobacteria bacterium]|nr:OFA family MFS transporter [Betaproteobacteria bacterium]